MAKNKFFALMIIIFMLFSVSGCGGGGSSASRFADTPISQDKPVPEPESNDIPITPEPSPQSQDKPVEPVPTPTPEPIISHDPFPEPVRYTVSFNSNGGSDVSSITVLSGNTINKPRNPKKHGSTFKGWYKDSALTQAFTFGTNGDKVTANITLYAKWIEDSVLAEIAVERVSIGYQDGDSASHVTGNITLPQNIDVSGDVANIIWSSNNEKVIYTNGTVTRQSTDVTVILTALSSIGTADKSRVFTLKVIHAETPAVSSYTVSFNSNGGNAVSSITVTSGNTVTQPANPSRSGYTFGGWYKDSALTQTFKFGSNGDKVTSNITLYAKWIETDILRAEAAIDKVSIGYQSGDSAGNVTKNLTLPTSVNASGDVSISWSSNTPSVISNSGAVTRPSGSDTVVVLTATATAGSVSRTKTFTVTVLHKATPAPSGYTVTFNSNGGSTVDSINVSSGGTVNVPENPTKAGYVFAGWFKDEVFTEIFTFGSEGDKITGNITLYAQWLDADLLIAEYAASEIAIGYADGDNPKYVTQNLTLPAKIGSADVSWSSVSAAVSASGNVTRQADDTDVTLTATAIYNGKSAQARTFIVKVIRKRTRDNHTIKARKIEDAASGDISIERNESGDITNIEGQYVSFDIRNADDALDAITVLCEELGIRSPDKELVLNGATINEYGAKYSLGQSYSGLKIYGRRIIVSANSTGNANFLDSNFLSSDVLAKANLYEGISQSQAEEIAIANYSNDVECTAKEVIYSFGEYENSPVRIWIVTVSGSKKNGSFADETFFIKSSDGAIISVSNNIMSMISNYGVNELSQVVQFPVTYEYSPLEFQGFNYMLDTDLNIEVFYERLPERLIAFNRVRLEPNTLWTDRHHVSAYTNMRSVIQLWKQKFSRSSLDNKGMRVKVITHNNCIYGDDGNIRKNNASWVSGNKVIIIDDHEHEAIAHSCAAALDVLAHESTHAVVQYSIGDDFVENGDIVAKAINEAYADIFACIMTEDESWKMGEDVFHKNSSFNCIRDIANPTSENAKSGFRDEWDALKGALDNSLSINEEHVSSHFISHAAYLMHKNGLSWHELRKLWYQTLHENVYTPYPKFSDVRREVVKAAKTIPSLKSKMAIIKNAFDEVGIYETVTLRGKIIYAENHSPIADIPITAKTLSETYGRIADDSETDTNGNFSLRLGKTRYNLETGYVFESENGEDFVSFVLPIELSKDKVITIVLARDGTASIDMTIPDTPTPINPDVPAPTNPDISVVSYDIPIDEKHFPDYWFRKYVKDMFDTDMNYKLSSTEINKVERIGLNHDGVSNSYGYISSLQGIELFTNLKYLSCNGHFITTLDVSKNTALTYLSCDDNELTALDVSKNTALTYLSCNSKHKLRGVANSIDWLDVSHNTALTELRCANNELTTLDISHNTALTWLYCNGNNLTSLDVRKNTDLIVLNCSFNYITKLDLSNCNQLGGENRGYLYLCNFEQRARDQFGYWLPKIEIIEPSSWSSSPTLINTASTTSTTSTTSHAQNLLSGYTTEILAILPSFTPAKSGIYTFTTPLDHTPPEGSSLILLADSEDLNGSFAFTESPDTVRVSTDFTAGRTYAPVIVAKTEEQEQSGGCNSGVLGMVFIAVLLRKRRC